MKDLGETGLILGTKIICSNEGFAQSQSHYTDKILKTSIILRVNLKEHHMTLV